MNKFIKELEKEVNNYFRNTSPEQIEQDIYNSGYEFYKDVKTDCFEKLVLNTQQHSFVRTYTNFEYPDVREDYVFNEDSNYFQLSFAA